MIPLISAKRPRRQKHPPGYQEIDLLSKMAEEGCPICHLIARSDRDYFFWFFNENYYEAYTLDALTRSLGFCLAHGASLAHNALGSQQLAAVHEVLVRRVRRTMLVHRPGPRRRSRHEGPGLARYADCPPCGERQGEARGLAFWLIRLLEDPVEADRYGHPGILCFPPFQLVVPGLSARALDRLLAIHEEAMAAHVESLDELQADLARNPSEEPRDLLKTLLPPLRLAVSHDAGNGAYPAPDMPGSSPRRGQDPVRDFLEGLRRPDACAVCLEVRRAWIEWVGWLDGAAARGLAIDDLLPACPEHVWPTVHLTGPALVMATVDRALRSTLGLLRSATQILHPPPPKERVRPSERVRDSLVGPRRRFRVARNVLARPVGCAVCGRLAVARDRAIELLFALLEDRQHVAALESGYGLCLKHFSRALALDPSPPVRAILTEVEAARLARLHWELDESLRKIAWNWRPEARGEEQTAWSRAVLRFSGSLAG